MNMSDDANETSHILLMNIKFPVVSVCAGCMVFRLLFPFSARQTIFMIVRRNLFIVMRRCRDVCGKNWTLGRQKLNILVICSDKTVGLQARSIKLLHKLILWHPHHNLEFLSERLLNVEKRFIASRGANFTTEMYRKRHVSIAIKFKV